jgi:hypothetical protein
MLRLGDLFSGGVDMAGGSILTSPLWTAVITVFIILLIIWFMMSKEVEPVYSDTSFIFLLLKVGVGIFVTQVVVQYLSSGAIERAISEKYKNKNQERIVARATDPNQSGITSITSIDGIVGGVAKDEQVPQLETEKETKTEININVIAPKNQKTKQK